MNESSAQEPGVETAEESSKPVDVGAAAAEVAGGLLQFSQCIGQPVVEAVIGHRALLLSAGFSQYAAEMMTIRYSEYVYDKLL